MEKILVHQLVRAVFSVGANVTEARNGNSEKEFCRYYVIALRSSNESLYWMKLLKEGFDEQSQEFEMIVAEANEISRILGASVIKLRRKNY